MCDAGIGPQEALLRVIESLWGCSGFCLVNFLEVTLLESTGGVQVQGDGMWHLDTDHPHIVFVR